MYNQNELANISDLRYSSILAEKIRNFDHLEEELQLLLAYPEYFKHIKEESIMQAGFDNKKNFQKEKDLSKNDVTIF